MGDKQTRGFLLVAMRRLVRPFGDDLAHDFAYYVIHRPDAANDPGIAAFKEWVLARARD